MLAGVSPRFGRECIDDVVGCIGTLALSHWAEAGHYKDLYINPDIAKYRQAERAGTLRLYTVRSGLSLVGYAVYFIGTALHYQEVLTAQQSTLYVHPDHRRDAAGPRFVKWTESQLRSEGVKIITQHVKAKNRKRGLAFCRLLEHDGYEIQDYVLTKRLDT